MAHKLSELARPKSFRESHRFDSDILHGKKALTFTCKCLFYVTINLGRSKIIGLSQCLLQSIFRSMKNLICQSFTRGVIAILLLGCGQENKKEPVAQASVQVLNPGTVKTGFSKIELVDKFTNSLYPDTLNEVTKALYSPIYIGPAYSNLKITYKTRDIGFRTAKFNEFEDPDKNSLSILIDTSRVIGSPMDLQESKETAEYRKSKASYPVVLLNTGKDTLTIGASNVMPLIMEAQDRSGKWRPIQKDPRFTCSNGSTEFYLPPDQIAISNMKLFSGSFKTKLRLGFYFTKTPFYSNEIVGFINETQFEPKEHVENDF